MKSKHYEPTRENICCEKCFTSGILEERQRLRKAIEKIDLRFCDDLLSKREVLALLEGKEGGA